jgi:uncharacterized membrane protein
VSTAILTEAPARTPRLLGMDAARGVAVLGMMAVHSLFEQNEDGSATAVYLTAGGRSAAMFAVLAGVGIAFTSGRARVRFGPDGRRAAVSLLVRGLVIGAIGLALGVTDPEIASVILPYYAVMFLLAIPLVFLPTGALAAVAVLLVGGAPVLSQVLRPGLPAPSGANPGLAQLVTDPPGLLSELTLTGYYPALTWVAYLAVGIVVGRLRLSSARTAAWLLGAGAVLAVAATLASAWLLGPLGGLDRIAAATAPEDLASAPTAAQFVEVYPEGVTPTTTWWWLATVAPHSGSPPDLVQTIGSSLALLGLLLLLGHVARPGVARVVAALLRPLAAVGALTLTVYTLHVAFLNSPLDQFDPLTGYVLQMVVAVLVAVGWRRAVGRGPLESLVRVLAAAATRGGRR